MDHEERALRLVELSMTSRRYRLVRRRLVLMELVLVVPLLLRWRQEQLPQQ